MKKVKKIAIERLMREVKRAAIAHLSDCRSTERSIVAIAEAIRPEIGTSSKGLATAVKIVLDEMKDSGSLVTELHESGPQYYLTDSVLVEGFISHGVLTAADTNKPDYIRERIMETVDSMSPVSPMTISRIMSKEAPQSAVFSEVDRMMDEGLVYFDTEEDVLIPLYR